MKDYTVIASIANEGTIVFRHVQALSDLHAFSVVAKEEDEREDGLKLEFLVSMPGHLREGEHFTLPGEGIVCAETVLEQGDVFGPPEPAHSETQGS